MKHLFLLLAALMMVSGVSAQRIDREDIEWLDVWIPHTNDTLELPRVLLIGNSIAKGYNAEVDTLLQGKAYVARISTSKSVGDPGLLAEVRLVMGYLDFDVVHFNNGLHGNGYSEQEYAAAFPELVQTIREYAEPGARLIWATTTPVYDRANRPEAEAVARVRERNRIAADCIQGKGIATNDLFALCISHPEFYAGGDGVHPNKQGYAALGAQVAAAIEKELTLIKK